MAAAMSTMVRKRYMLFPLCRLGIVSLQTACCSHFCIALFNPRFASDLAVSADSATGAQCEATLLLRRITVDFPGGIRRCARAKTQP